MKKRKPERFLLEVVKGGFSPADGYTRSRLKEKNYHTGDVVLAQLTKPRNPKFHRMVHVFGQMLKDNIDEFQLVDAHAVIKRLQIEARIQCEEVAVKIPGFGYTNVMIPRSLSFADMDEGEFTEFYRAICHHVAENYWPTMTPEQIEQMAGLMTGE